MIKLLQIVIFLLSITFGIVVAQDRTITGKVTDKKDGLPLPGVLIVVTGTKAVKQTDINGGFTLSVPLGKIQLEFSYIGYKSKLVDIAGENEINVTLEADIKLLQEVVISGQGLGIEKKRLSTTVDVISAEQLAKTPVIRLDQLLQSQLPSAQIRLSSGQPGTASLIRSRGIVSASTSATPVIYVDGVRVDNLNTSAKLSGDFGGSQSSSIPDIPVEDIERIEFIKGGAATTLYGSDAANGVIQIFTKNGIPGKSEVNFEVQLGAVKGVEDYLKYKQTADLLFQTGLSQSYRLGLSGGSDKITYSFSGNAYQNDGFRPNNQETRYNFRTSLTSKINDKVHYISSLGFTSNKFGRDENANSSFSTFGNLENGTYGDLSKLNPDQLNTVKKQKVNQIQGLVDNSEVINRFQTSQSITYKPLQNLSTKFTLGIDARNNMEKKIVTNAYLIAQGEIPGTTDKGSIEQYNRYFVGLTGDFGLQYITNWRKFSFITTAGSQFFRNIDRQTAIIGTNVAEGSRSINNAATRTAKDFEQTIVNYGFFGSENIGFDDKIFLEFGLRIDGNSAFGKEVGLQAYPKLGLAYDLAVENFLENKSLRKWLSSIKLRANYGAAGNFPTPFANEKTLSVNSYLGTLAYNLGQVGDPNLKPEKVQTYEAGVDLSLLDYQVNLSATYYSSKTKDALFLMPFPPSLGINSQLKNIGELLNCGWEFSSAFHMFHRHDLSLKFNASYNLITESMVTSSGNSPEFIVGGFSFLGSFVKEGKPVGYLRGNKPTFSADGTLADVEVNADLGNPIPKHSGSLGLNFTYKHRWNLYITGDYQIGAQGVNVDEVLRFFKGVQDGRVPEASDNESFFDLAGVWIEDTDYFKVRNISLSYTLPEHYFSNQFIKRIELGINMINPLNFFTSNFDPEITGAGAQTQGGITVGGFGYGTESPARQFIGTLRIKL